MELFLLCFLVMPRPRPCCRLREAGAGSSQIRGHCLSTAVIGACLAGALENLNFQEARLQSRTDAALAL